MKMHVRSYFFILLGLVVLLASCRKTTDELFDETADERLAKALAAYQNKLMEGPGWKLFVYPNGLQSEGIDVGGLTYYLTFPDSNRTVMVSDFTFDMAAVPKESSFSLKGLQLPSLIFDTYSYIHAAADPDEAVSFSPTGTGGYGWGTDFEFGFTSATPSDTILLEGNFNKSTAYLIKATSEEMNAAFGGGMADIMQATSNYATDNAFLYFNASDNAKIGVSFNLYLYIVNFNYVEGGELLTVPVPFSHTTYGIHFKEPVTLGGYTFQDAYWDDAQNIYYLDINGTRINIVNSQEPLFDFNLVLGRSITTITVPTSPLPGQSQLFEDVYEEVKSNLLNSLYQLTLGDMRFIFDAESGSMSLDIDVFQGSARFLVRYVYSYTMNSSNDIDFIRMGANGNATLVEEDMQPLLDFIDNHVFTGDYFTGTSPVLGQFTSKNNTNFFFTGTLQ